jgi:hypothetical protein
MKVNHANRHDFVEPITATASCLHPQAAISQPTSNSTRTPWFMNVDLEIDSKSNLDSLALEMRKRVTVLHSGPMGGSKRQLLALETARHYKGPDATIHAFCSVIEKLSPASHRIWKAARKVFDIGYELRPGERLSRFGLRTDTLQRIAKLGATLAVSYYRGVSDEAMFLEAHLPSNKKNDKRDEITVSTINFQEADRNRDTLIDQAILATLGRNWVKVLSVIFNVSLNKEIALPARGEGYDLIAKRIEFLLSEGRLEAQGDIKKWRDTKIRLR